jgi:signal peptidase
MRTIRRCMRIALQLAAVLSVLTLLVLGIGPHSGAYRPVTVLTQSMQPTLPAGSVAFITPMEPRAVRVGDAITYRIPVEDRRVVTHRVVEILQGGSAPVVRTKGDALDTADSWTTKLTNGPVWKVRASVPYVGFALRALQQPEVRRLTVTVVPGLLAVSLLAQIWIGGANYRGRHRKPSRWGTETSAVAAR